MELVYDGNIKGAFHGWKRGMVYELANGQRFRVRHNPYKLRYAYRPRARIWQDGPVYFLEVEGMGQPIEVRAVRYRY
jgi:hypothetical protein